MPNTIRLRFLTFLDQALSSLTNFGGSALAAGLLTAPDFGAFAVAVSFLIIVLGVARAWSGYVLMIIAPTANDRDFAHMLAGSGMASVLVGAVGAAVAMIAAGVIGGVTGHALVALAVCMPLVTVQDSYRFGALCRRQPARACVNDGLWLLGSVAGLLYLRRAETPSLGWAVVAANATAVLGVLYAVRGSDVPRAGMLGQWLRRSKGMSIRLTGEFLVAIASSIVPLVIITAWNADLDQAGALRGAQAMMGPLAVLFAASSLYAQPIMVSAHRDGRSVIGLARVQSGVNLAAAVVWIVVAWLIPARLGVRLFGASWAGLHDIVVVVGVSFLGLAISSGPLTAIRSRGQLNAGLATQFMVAVLVLLSTALGGLLIDQGTLRGFAAGNVLASGIAWLVLTRWRVRDLVGERSAPRQ